MYNYSQDSVLDRKNRIKIAKNYGTDLGGGAYAAYVPPKKRNQPGACTQHAGLKRNFKSNVKGFK